MDHRPYEFEHEDEPMTAVTADHLSPLPRPGGRAVPRWHRLEAAARARPGPSGPARRNTPSHREIVFRRRRLAIAGLLMALAFVAGVVLALTLLSSPAGGSLTEEARRARQITHVVEPGDTLWSVAGVLAPGDDPRAVVDALSAARGSSVLVPGDVVVWPVD